MESSWKKILEEIERLQILTPEEFQALKTSSRSSGNPSKCLSDLVRDQKMTKYQALSLMEGKGARLQIGNYLILKPLGQGGMGQVLKARHTQMNRIVAIKIISPHLASHGVASRRFSNEIRFLAQMFHPNIVQAFDADVHEGVPFLVTEYVEGVDLRKLVEKSGPLDAYTALKYMSQTASALAYAHKNNIVHRDVKPANLIVKSDGQIKLLDLGIARANEPTEGSGADMGLTADNAIVGSLEYTSPEQLMSSKSVGPRSDIYSFGCTLYYLMRGVVPYPGKTPMDFFRLHPTAPIPKLCDRDQVLASELNSLFTKLVAKKPEQRIQTMDEVEAEINRLLKSPELSDEEPSTDEMAPRSRRKSISIEKFVSSSNADLNLPEDGPWYKRKPVMMAGGVAASVMLLGVVVWQLTAPKKPKSGPESAATEFVDRSQPPGQKPEVLRVRGSEPPDTTKPPEKSAVAPATVTAETKPATPAKAPEEVPAVSKKGPEQKITIDPRTNVPRVQGSRTIKLGE